MLIDLKKIQESKHILIVVKDTTFANASAFYSYILTLHKKVSLYKSEDISNRVAFLPWYDKLRDTKLSSAAYTLSMESDTQQLYAFFKMHEIKINKKMATALYMGLLEEYKNFTTNACDGITFAVASELIALGAEYKICREYYLRRVPLAIWRLKMSLYESMTLSEDARSASLFISDEILKASGASLENAIDILNDAVNLVHVRKATLYKSDDNNKIIKEIRT